jgi:exosortase/archaeosortase family protein
VPTDTTGGRTDAIKFALAGVAWSLGLFGLLRLNWTEVHAVLPFTRVQAAAAVGLFGPAALPVEVTLACSGADAIALCLGAVLAYPVSWRTRLAGAGAGVGLILGLNIVRIGTLGLAAASPEWFNALHVYLWPALLTLAITGYVFAWMRLADTARQAPPSSLATATTRPTPPSPSATARQAPQPSRRFILLAVAFLLLFTAASPLYLQSAGVLALAGFIARAAAAILGVVGVGAYALANVLWTPRGSFIVTQECVSTPLIPVYLAAVCAHSTTWRRLILGVLATAPLFIALGIVRLLVVALPDAVTASPLFLVHAFYQLLLGAVAVFLAARWRHGRAAPRSVLHAPRHLSGGPADRRSAGSDRVPPGVPGRPLPRALGRGVRRGRLEALPHRARGPPVDADGSPARTVRSGQPLRADGARARRPRLGGRRPFADRGRGGQHCPAAPLKSPRSPPWP